LTSDIQPGDIVELLEEYHGMEPGTVAIIASTDYNTGPQRVLCFVFPRPISIFQKRVRKIGHIND